MLLRCNTRRERLLTSEELREALKDSANVLFPFSLRDVLLRAAADDFFQLYWSEQILDEMERNLVATDTVTSEQAARLRSAMSSAFPEALVTGHDALIDAMPIIRRIGTWSLPPCRPAHDSS